MIVVNILDGSTNAELHLIAMADSVGITLTIDDFQAVSDKTAYLADLRPSGKYVMHDLFEIEGTPAVPRFLLKEGVVNGNTLTVTGKTMAENLAMWPNFTANPDIIRPFNKPLKPNGHIQIMRGSLAPGGPVGKITGKEGLRFEGIPRCFNCEDAFIEAMERGKVKKGYKTVAIIRYKGPKGGPGMPEMLKPTAVMIGAGLGNDMALLTDGRYSGGSHGFIVDHIVPEALEGGPIALVRGGDVIAIDAQKRVIDLRVSDAELELRRQS